MKEIKFGVKIRLLKDFAVIKETLTRMGIVNKRKKEITPTCYLLQHSGNYYICHFKELLAAFDDIPDELCEKDKDRRDSICTMLENWGLIECIDRVYQEELKENIAIVLYNDKRKYNYRVNDKFTSFADLMDHLAC